MTDASRAQGGLICLAAVAVGALFAIGLARQSYWALAIPVALAVGFGLALSFWVGWTIATIRVEPEAQSEPSAPEAEAEPASDASR